MQSSENPLNTLAKQVMTRLGGKDTACGSSPKSASQNCGQNQSVNGSSDNSTKPNKPFITPAQALVIAGLIGGVLEIDSVLVDRDQEVQIVLAGSLKQKTSLEKTMDEIGSMPFDDVLKAMVGRL